MFQTHVDTQIGSDNKGFSLLKKMGKLDKYSCVWNVSPNGSFTLPNTNNDTGKMCTEPREMSRGWLSVKFLHFGQSVQESNQISIFYYFRVFLMYFW